MVTRTLVSSMARVDRVLADAHLPGRPGVDDNVVAGFVRRSVPWSAEPIPLPPRLRRAIWVLIPVQLVWGLWLGLITAGASSCGGAVCRVATLGQHPAVLLGCSVVCLVGLVILAPFTHGFARANAGEVTGLIIATVAGGVTVLGIAALGTAILLAVIVIGAFLAAFSFTP